MKSLSKIAQSWRHASLRLGIGLAIAAGLLVPALIGMALLAHFRGLQIGGELEADLKGKIALVANSLATPVWNFDSQRIRMLSETAMLDPRVVRITVTDPANQALLNLEQAERRLGNSLSARHDLVLSGERSGTRELAGKVEIELDDGLRRQEFSKDLRSYLGLLLGQFVLSLVLVLVALHLRVFRPLAKLTQFSDQLAQGEFDRAIDWKRSDEIGLLAQQMDTMRHALKLSFSEQRVILGNVHVGVVFERQQTIQLANRHAEMIFGYAPQGLVNQPLRSLFQSDDQLTAVKERVLGSFALPNSQYEESLFLRRFDNSVFWAHLRCSNLDLSHPEAGNIWVIDDISDRRAAEEEINKLAFYDSLTLLPNRRLLLDRLARALVASGRSGQIGALLFIDLDEFKTINDTLGHDKGDLLLQEAARRLLDCVRDGDTVARLGGDEFVVMLEGLSDNQDEVATHCEVVGGKILDAFQPPFLLNRHEVRCTPSIGVTLFDGQLNLIDEVLKQADLAMYQAKAAGRNTLRFFDAAMQAVVNERAALESELREAVRTQQFVLHYQPQILGQDQLTGVEALVRWKHPRRGIVAPAEFIALAEDTGLILPLGNWVLEAACKQLAAWAGQPHTAQLYIAVNVSAKQLHQGDFVDQVVSALEKTGAKPQLLKLELTESHLVSNLEKTIGKMAELKARGLGFSLDDFGTGYSSLTYLKRLPLDQLKIDQGFVRDILIDPDDAAIARMVIALAASLGLTVIAEGVELQGQCDFLAEQGCHAYQGYFFSRPLPIVDFEAYARQLSEAQQIRLAAT